MKVNMKGKLHVFSVGGSHHFTGMGAWLFLVDIFQDQIKMTYYSVKHLNSKTAVLALVHLPQQSLPVK